MKFKNNDEMHSAAYVDLVSIAKWILENPGIHPNNIISTMKRVAQDYDIKLKKPEDHGTFILEIKE